jgi:regulation of enolase protein 1 (concanavalin A-like superfamily)
MHSAMYRKSRAGDFTFIARVDSMTNTNTYAKAGLMVRELFSPTSRHIMLAQTPTTSDGTKMIRRDASAADTVNVNWSRSTLPPRWLKLVRTGSTFTGSQSVDGQTWTVVGSTCLALPATVHVGLAVASQAPPSLLTAQFSNVSLK